MKTQRNGRVVVLKAKRCRVRLALHIVKEWINRKGEKHEQG